MFTFRKATVLFFALLLLMNLLRLVACRNGWMDGHFCDHPWSYVLTLAGIYIGVSVLMAFVIRSGFHYPALCRAGTHERICGLTFDDGPHPEYTLRILEILEREKIPAAFFLIGSKIKGNEHLLKRMTAQGNIVGNHSWSHHHGFDFFPARKIRRELMNTAEAIKGATGLSPLLFRPPYGVLNPLVKRALRQLPWLVIGWDVRSFDTLIRDPAQVADRIAGKVKPGSVIVLHDTSPHAAQILEILLPLLKMKGFSISPVNEMFNIRAYE